MDSTTTTQDRTGTTRDQATVGEVLDEVRADGREALSAPEAKRVCDAYGIDVPGEGLATSADEAVVARRRDRLSGRRARSSRRTSSTRRRPSGVLVGLKSADEVRRGFDTIVENAKAYKSDAEITGVQIQQMLPEGTRCSIGADQGPDVRPGRDVRPRRHPRRGAARRDVPARADVTARTRSTWSTASAPAEILHGVRGRAGRRQRRRSRTSSRRSPSWSPTSRRSPRSTSTRCSRSRGRRDGRRRALRRRLRPARTTRPPRYSRRRSSR